ncbi:MAG: glycosyltransferase family 4 protein [Gemmatimonadota bacterium]
MRVCLFTETFHPVIGGGETQARLLAEGLTAGGVPTFVLTRRSDAALPSSERVGTLPVVRLRPTGSGQLKKWGLVLSGVPELVRRRRDYDVLLLCGFRIIGLSAVLVAKALGKRVVLKADSQGEMSGAFFTAGLARFGVKPSSFAFRTFLRLRNAILRRGDAFVAITEAVAEELRAAAVSEEEIHRIPNAVDTERFSPAGADEKRALRHRLGLPQDGAIVTYTGRLVTYKGLPLLVDVWSRLRARFPDALLLLVGTGGLDIHACENELRSTVRERGMEGSVRFTGGVENVEDYLKASDAFAFPTENDAFPSSVIEAMTTRLPVITTPVGAIPEIVTDGVNGLLVPAGDGPALETALARVLADPALADALGSAAWSTVQERYSAGGVTARYLELLETVCGPENGPGPPDPGAP